MKLSQVVLLGGAALAAIGAGAAIGCSGGTTNSSSGGGGQPPPAPTGPTTGITKEHNYAIHKLYLGDTDRNITPSNNAWTTFGYNLDGKNTTAQSTDVCQPVMGGYMGNKQQVDGANGIDNSFGHNIIPLVMNFASTPTKTVSDAIN